MSWCRHPIAPGSVTQPGRPYFPREKSRETDASVIRSDERTHGFPAIARSAARRRQATSTRLMREERKNEAHSEIGCADTFDGPDETRSACRDLDQACLRAAPYRASPHFRDQCTRHLV